MQTIMDFIKATEGGQVFTATYTKRTTGEVRVMNCRQGVSKGVVGTGLSYDPTIKALLPVYDMQAQGHRQISLDALISVKLGGKLYRWNKRQFEEVTQ